MSRNTVLIAAVAVAALLVVVRLLVRTISPKPANLGVTNGRLAECPDSPNCVSTEANDAEHVIPPLSSDEPPAAAFERLRAIVEAQSGAELVAATDDYLRFEFTSRWMGFIDDVEFLLDRDTQAIRFRSASRLGRSDLGVNRARMEAIRRAFERGK